MESSTSQKTIPKKQARRSRGRKAQTNPAPQTTTTTPPISTPPAKILQRNNKKINIGQPAPMVMSPQEVQQPQIQHDYTLTEALDDVLIRFILNCPE